MVRESEIKRLRQDLERVRAESGWRGLGAWFLEVASWVQIFYRLFRAWRLSPVDVPPLRYFLEKVVEAVTHIHLPSGLDAGPGLRIYHGYGLIVNRKSRLGTGCTLYARVTLGERFPGDACPLIGNGVILGTGAAVFGPITIEDGRRIKAHQVIY